MARSRRRSLKGPIPLKPHRASDYLKSPEEAAAYLSATVEEMGDDPLLLMTALRSVAEAQRGVAEVAREAERGRVTLSRALAGGRTQGSARRESDNDRGVKLGSRPCDWQRRGLA